MFILFLVVVHVSSRLTSAPAASSSVFFFFNDPATTKIYPLSLPDALPIYSEGCQAGPEGIGRLFPPAVGMKNQRRLAASPQPSTIEGVQGQRQIAVDPQAPAEDPPRVSKIGRAHV